MAKAGFPENIQENYRRHIKWDAIVTKAGGQESLHEGLKGKFVKERCEGVITER